MTDLIDKAVEAVEQTVQMVQVNGTMADTGRPFYLAIPADITDAELLGLLGWMSSQLAVQLRGQRPSSRLVLPK